MDDTQKEKLAKYAELKREEKRIASAIAELGPVILNMIVDLGVDKVETTFGRFIVVKRTSFTYSDNVTDLEESLEALKEQEKAEGIAKAVKSNQLQYRAE